MYPGFFNPDPGPVNISAYMRVWGVLHCFKLIGAAVAKAVKATALFVPISLSYVSLN